MPSETTGVISPGARLFKLKNTVKHYDWGSPRRIPELLGVENPGGLPWAELWMGVHPEGPSEISAAGGSLPLSELIRTGPRHYLGEGMAKTFGTLPFLFKLLAAGKPLSIQAHPNKAQAEAGWERENARSLPLKDPARNYRDRNHKPEILAAIDPFTAMCGFREPAEIARLLDCFLSPMTGGDRAFFGDLRGTLAGGNAGLRNFLEALLGLDPPARRILGVHALSCRDRLERDCPDYRAEWELCAAFARDWPGDPAIIAPLYLNLVNLRPGEAIYLPAGVLHAYVSGFGAELMASSDNVLRGGLTNKHVDGGELLSILNYAPFRPAILKPAAGGRYPSNCEEFSLTLLEGGGDERNFPGPGPAILALIAGEAEISTGAERLRLRPGESAFAAAGGELRLRGTYTLYAAEPGGAGSR